MRAALSVALGLAVALVVAARVSADDKEVTLKGTITCAKCDLKVDGQTKCHTVIVVKKGDAETVYWFDKDGSKNNAEGNDPAEASVGRFVRDLRMAGFRDGGCCVTHGPDPPRRPVRVPAPTVAGPVATEMHRAISRSFRPVPR